MARSFMNIAILHYAGPPGLGGVELTIHHHARLLCADGHRVRLVAGSGTSTVAGVEQHINPLFGSRGAMIERVNRALAQGDVADDFLTLYRETLIVLRDALDGADVVMVHNVMTLHKNLALTAALRTLHDDAAFGGLLAWCHDFAWRDPLYLPELHPGQPWDLLRTPWPRTRYVVVSDDRRTMLADLLGLDEAQIAVVTPGVDPQALLKLEAASMALILQHGLFGADPLLLLPARITRRKNIEQAIRIIAALVERGLRPKLVVTGTPGPHNPTNVTYLAQLQELQAASAARDAILWLYSAYCDADGRPLPVDDNMLADFYRIADGLLFPSRAEGFGMPMIEAALSGLPIFCSDIAPFRETAGDAAHYFDPQGDPAMAAAQIAAVLRDDARYVLKKRVARAYTWEAIYQSKITPLLTGDADECGIAVHRAYYAHRARRRGEYVQGSLTGNSTKGSATAAPRGSSTGPPSRRRCCGAGYRGSARRSLAERWSSGGAALPQRARYDRGLSQ
ncbi:glycosyltransferase family 4 protein [Candidatus Gracilibacteria bacterium]|nr:glycosyltransferase family 4 protein [Candidatus Gracilibacteria bacterium]